MRVKFKKLFPERDADLSLPEFKTKGAAAMDIVAAEFCSIIAGGTAMVKTGLAAAVPEGYVMLMFPRSGLAAKHDITLANAVGVIDSDYRGEICALVRNESDKNTFHVNRGDRIAQIMIVKHEQPVVELVDDLDETERGTGGFGSTGV